MKTIFIDNIPVSVSDEEYNALVYQASLYLCFCGLRLFRRLLERGDSDGN